jgi:outer membrane protein assembly factor BamB
MATEHGMVYVQGINDTFYALRASDGHVLWQYDMSKDVSGVDAVVDGLVYFNSSNTLTMYVLRGSDGVRLWQHKIDADHYPSHILAANGIVYVSAEYSRVTALRESDGVQLWQYDTGTVPPGNPLSMVLANGVVYAVSNQTTALRASDGTVLWHFSGAGPLMAENDVVYVSADQLYALRASDGRQLWHWHFPISTGVYSLTLNNGIIYAGPASSKLFVNRQYTETYTNHLYALKDSTGSFLWDHALPQSRVVIRVSGGSVYTLSRDALDVLQSSNGSLLWHHPLQQVGLLVADGTVYAGTAGSASTCFPLTNSKLTALRPTDGTQFWQFEAGTVSDPTLN